MSEEEKPKEDPKKKKDRDTDEVDKKKYDEYFGQPPL